MKRSEIERWVQQIAWPEPADELRSRVLSSVPRLVPNVTWSDRMWFSRAWRLSAAAVLGGLIVVESWAASPGSARFAPTARASAEAQAIEATVRELGLPAGLATALARRSMGADARPDMGSERDRLALDMFDLEGDRQ